MSMYVAAMGAQRMQAPRIAGFLRLLIATLSGAALAQGWGSLSGKGPDGHFSGVALGISTDGLVCAWGCAGVRLAGAAGRRPLRLIHHKGGHGQPPVLPRRFDACARSTKNR